MSSSSLEAAASDVFYCFYPLNREEALRLSREAAAQEQSQQSARHRVGSTQNPPHNQGAPARYSQHQSADPKPFLQKVSEGLKQWFGSKK